MNKLPLIILTAYSGKKKIIISTINHLLKRLTKNDLWIIVLDNPKIENFIYLKKNFKKIILLNYSGCRGAGNARNFGLKYIYKNIKGQFLLLPFDGDDRLTRNSLGFIKKTMINSKYNVVSFGHCKIWPNGDRKIIKYSGIFNLSDLLKKYITPCGSTVLKIGNPKVLKFLQFGKRFRANDALFFYQAVKYFGKFQCNKKVILKYKVGYSKTLSGKKYLMAYYKYLSLRDFKISRFKTIVYLLHYMFYGIQRHLFKQSV
jgi:glycosyltransferase involved in cell wall biosynthesis